MIEFKSAKIWQKEMTRKEFLGFSVFTMASVFGIVGLIKELTSRAATPTASFEAEDGTVTAPAKVVADSASGGSAIKFGTPTVTSNPEFTIGTVKPTAANTGAGIIRPYPTGAGGTLTGTQTISGATVVSGKIINGDVNISGTAQLLDCIVHGRVSCKGGTPLIENCVVDGNSGATGAAYDNIWLINTNSSVTTTVRFTTVKASVAAVGVNGIGTRNMLVEYCDISCVIDCIDVDGVTAGSDGTANATIQGCYLHDMMFFSPDPGHDPVGSPITTTNVPYTGPHLDERWSHDDCIQLTAGAKDVQFIGNNVQAKWTTTVGSLPIPTANMQLSCMMLNSCIGLKAWYNWFDYGAFAINVALGVATESADFKGNRFGRNMAPYGLTTAAPYTIYVNSSLPTVTAHVGTVDQNVYEDDGTPITVRGPYDS